MGKGFTTIIIVAVIVVAYALYISSQPAPNTSISSDIKIANWNLQIFGITKSSNPNLMSQYAGEIAKYDIVFIQEIRDSTNTSFSDLCRLLPDYKCDISSRAGRTQSKEQYGLIVKKNITILSFEDLNPDIADRWERPPIKVVFGLNNYSVTVFNIHIDPDNVSYELTQLEYVAKKEQGYVMVIGDLNADCDYYNPVDAPEFKDWAWIVKDTDDSTVGASNCAYDRIIINQNLKRDKYVTYGVDSSITSDLSDHRAIFLELKN